MAATAKGCIVTVTQMVLLARAMVVTLTLPCKPTLRGHSGSIAGCLRSGMALLSAPRGVVVTTEEANLPPLSTPLLKRCLSFCEDGDLLRLGYTSKQFNKTALSYLLSRYGAEKWLFKFGTMISLNHFQRWSPCLTAALHSTLFIWPLTWLKYDFHPDDKQLVDDVRHLKYLLPRLSPGTRIQFCFSHVDSWVFNGGTFPSLDFEGWLAEFRDLLYVALGRGRSHLHVESGSFFLTYFRNIGASWLHSLINAGGISRIRGITTHPSTDSTPISRTKKTNVITRLKDKITRNIASHPRMGSLTSPSLPTETPVASNDQALETNSDALMDGRDDLLPTNTGISASSATFQSDLLFNKVSLSTSRNTLTHFGAHSPLLFEPPLLDWTLDVVRSSTALQEFTFWDVCLPSSVWCEILDKTYLPKLEKFTINYTWIIHEPTGIPLQNLTPFLQRHRGITSLELSGIDMDDVQFVNLNPGGSLLPKLQNLVAHPQFIERFFSHPNASLGYSHLQSITICGEYFSTFSDFPKPMPPFNFTTFNCAFPPIAAYPNVNVLSFHLPYANPRLLDGWIQMNLDLGSSSPIVELANVKRLIFLLCQATRLADNTCRLLPEFLNLFPVVELVSIQGIPPDTKLRLKGNAFRRAMGQSCPRIKSYYLDGEEIKNECPEVAEETGVSGLGSESSDEPIGA